MATGAALIIGGGLVIGLKGYYLDELEVEDKNVRDMVTWGGLALIASGGVVIALADIGSPVGVFPMRGGGGVVKRIAW